MKCSKFCEIPFILLLEKRSIVGDCSPTLFMSSSDTSVSEIECSQTYSLKTVLPSKLIREFDFCFCLLFLLFFG